MPATEPPKPFAVKSTLARDLTFAVAAGIAFLAVIAWAILHMAEDFPGNALLTGTVTAKHFQPRPEEQLTMGPGGLDRKDLDGIYTMEVRTQDGKTFTVYVEKPVYVSHNNGDQLSFLPPPPSPR